MKSVVPDNAAISCRIVDRSVEPRQQVEFLHEAVIEMGGGMRFTTWSGRSPAAPPISLVAHNSSGLSKQVVAVHLRDGC